MNLPPSKEPYDGYCGTSYAAKMLGISVGTVQGLVEKMISKHGRPKAVTVAFLCSRFKSINVVTT